MRIVAHRGMRDSIPSLERVTKMDHVIAKAVEGGGGEKGAFGTHKSSRLDFQRQSKPLQQNSTAKTSS